jgi:selenocysteine lyase/cysteine desulfurase
LLAAHFQRFLAADPQRLHFAAHSHHPWPDVTQAAHARYWSDAATLLDRKWDRVFGEVVPRAQDHVARLLHLDDARQVAFAPNTHEFVRRLYSCLPGDRPLRVLTSAHEFHSFRRQTRRLQESGRVIVEEIAGPPWESFTQRFCAAARAGAWDLVWLSHVFFDSGFVVPDLEAICDAAPAHALVAIDGYHAFCALPVDLLRVHRRAFYIAGGYKYAMSGEGACFLAIPPGTRLRPEDTGWFASFDARAAAPGARVSYAHDAFGFWGSTFDPSGLYRFNAAMDWLLASATTIADVHRHSLSLQKHFLDGLARLALPRLPAGALVPPPTVARGNFLAFEVDNAEDVHERISAQNVAIDRRDRRLRFGFGVYHAAADVDALLQRVRAALQ